MRYVIRLLSIGIAVVMTGMLYSCNDIIDRKLTDISLQVYYPTDSFLSFNYLILFQWEPVIGAQGYRLQIAQPNFSAPQTIITDTFVKGSKFTVTLLPGKYLWRMRAENGSSYSQYITRTLFVDSGSNLNGQAFYPLTPLADYVTNSTSVVFSWNKFPYANKYEYVLTDTVGAIVHNLYTYGTSLTDALPVGVHFWKVRALDTVNFTSTQYSVARKLTIDTASPIVSQPLSPADNGISANLITITWARLANDAMADSVFLANDTLFNSIVHKAYVFSATSHTFPSLPQNQKYFWRLRTRDVAGNWSVYSSIYRFRVN